MLFDPDPPDWETDGARWPHREFSAFHPVDRHRWRVERMGEGPVALLLHGTGASAHSFAGLAPLLARDWDVIAPDLPGHGFTRAARGFRASLDNTARAVASLLRTLEAPPMLILGHSAGAAIAVQMILDGLAEPKTLISVNGALAPFEGAAGFLFPTMAKLLHYNPFTAQALAGGARDRARVERLLVQTGSDPPDELVDCYHTLLQRPGHVAGALAMMAHWELGPIRRGLAKLPTRALFLAGETDRATPPETAREAAQLAPNGVFEALPDLGHLAHEEAPRAVYDAIQRFGLG